MVPNSFFRLQVRENGDGTIRMTMPLGFTAPSDCEPVGPLLYRRVGGDGHLAFGQVEHGRVTQLFPVLMMAMAFEGVLWYDACYPIADGWSRRSTAFCASSCFSICTRSTC